MPIAWRTDHLLSVAVPSGSPAEVLGPAWEKGYNHPAGALKRQRYWSFAAFDERFLSAISGSDLAQHPLEEFLDRDRVDKVNILKELVVRALVARHEKLRWHAFKKLAYFRRREPEQDVEYAWTKAKPRTVVQARFSTEEDRHFTGYRHDAAELTIRDLDDQWAVQINPTYLFTKVNSDDASPRRQASEEFRYSGLVIPSLGRLSLRICRALRGLGAA
jgi:hypothetical protein